MFTFQKLRKYSLDRDCKRLLCRCYKIARHKCECMCTDL